MKLWTGSYIFTTCRQPSAHAAAVVIESVLLKFLLGSSCLFKSLALLILLSWLVHLVKSLPLHTLEPRKRYPFRAEPPHIGHHRKYPPPPPLVLNLYTFINDADDETIACAWWCLQGFIWTSSNRFMNCCQGQISTLYTIENVRDEPQCLRA